MRLCLRFPFSLPAVVNVSRGFSFPPRISDAPKEKRAEGKERPLPLPVYYMFATFQRLFESSLFCDTVHSHFPLCGVGVGAAGRATKAFIHSSSTLRRWRSSWDIDTFEGGEIREESAPLRPKATPSAAAATKS